MFEWICVMFVNENMPTIYDVLLDTWMVFINCYFLVYWWFVLLDTDVSAIIFLLLFCSYWILEVVAFMSLLKLYWMLDFCILVGVFVEYFARFLLLMTNWFLLDFNEIFLWIVPLLEMIFFGRNFDVPIT